MKDLTLRTVKDMARRWWLILLGGILLVLLGIWTLTSPAAAYLSLSLVFAAGMLMAGIFELSFAFWGAGSGWTVVSGIIDLSIGGYLLAFPVITMAVLPLILGFWILIRGFMAIGAALELRGFGVSGWGWLLFSGILIIALAGTILAYPAWGITNIIIWTGAAFIFAGIFRIYLSFRLKELK